MADYPYTPLYYGTPCFVRYYDPAADGFNYGIAYHDQICTHIGTIIPITTCIIEAQNHYIHWDEAVVECDWRDLNYLM